MERESKNPKFCWIHYYYSIIREAEKRIEKHIICLTATTSKKQQNNNNNNNVHSSFFLRRTRQITDWLKPVERSINYIYILLLYIIYDTTFTLLVRKKENSSKYIMKNKILNTYLKKIYLSNFLYSLKYFFLTINYWGQQTENIISKHT